MTTGRRQGFAAAAAMILAVALLAGCEDEGGPLRCPEMKAVGGNPVGVWERMDVCLQPDPDEMLFAACPDIRPIYQGTHVLGGTFELRADGSYREQSTVTQSARFEVPLRCVPQAKSCAELAAVVDQALEVPAPGQVPQATIFCRGTDPCRCALELQSKVDLSGTYRIDGSNYVLDGSQPGQFSIVGNELRIQEGKPDGHFLTSRFLRQ